MQKLLYFKWEQLFSILLQKKGGNHPALRYHDLSILCRQKTFQRAQQHGKWMKIARDITDKRLP